MDFDNRDTRSGEVRPAFQGGSDGAPPSARDHHERVTLKGNGRGRCFSERSHYNAERIVIPFPSGPKLPPYARRVVALRRTRETLLEVLTGSAAMDEAARRFELEAKYGDPPTSFVALPFERNPSAYDWTFAAGMDVAIITVGRPETDISLLHAASLVLTAGASHAVVRLLARVEILRRDEGGRIWKLH
ncbi:hypothetical protein [Methylocaldum szegediense]|uniref:Uncharacterized protein n=1 Tax=Methylocaldum szegediense TaxID=73780 RepID=A0ABN8X044_9GAMM|nr:hypothetical protein [Methylocaldum szegediense]CAI8749192.1 protein of unknown function [Methylocaldum szegediense]